MHQPSPARAIDSDLLERVLTGLGVTKCPAPDLDGLRAVYAGFSGNVANDNIRKRIWLTGERDTPVAGGDPADFFENWLAHGTGGTCFPINGAFSALLDELGFDARRICASMMMPGVVRGTSNHASVIATVDGVDYIVDAQVASFEPLALIPGEETSIDTGIHSIRAAPIEDGFQVFFWSGHMREHEYRFETEPENDPVDQRRFLDLYDRSANVEGYSPFNHQLYVSRHFPDSIQSIHRGRRVSVTADGSVSVAEVDHATMQRSLVEDFGVSEELAGRVPPDDLGGPGLP